MTTANTISYPSHWKRFVNSVSKKVNRVDILIAILFILFGFAFFLLRWKGIQPFIYIYHDNGRIASSLVAEDQPELFSDDMLLSDLDNFDFYRTFYATLLKATSVIANTDYGTATALLLVPHIALQAIGFYILGRVLFHNRYWAGLFAATHQVYYPTSLYTYWGLYLDSQARMTFQAVLPFVLVLAIIWRKRPGFWPLLMIICGLLVHVHMVSAPAWGFAIWLGLWTFRPPAWSLKKQLGVMVALGLLFLVVCAPFAFSFSSSTDQTAPDDIDAFRAKYMEIMSEEFLRIRVAVDHLIGGLTKYGLLQLGIIGVLVIYIMDNTNVDYLKLVGFWTGGIIVVSMFLPFVDQRIALATHRFPVAASIARNMRYLVPILLLLCIWMLVVLYRRANSRHKRVLVSLVGAGFTIAWIGLYPPTVVDPAVLSRANYYNEEAISVLDAVRDITEPGDKILPVGYFVSLAVRYYAMRPVVFDLTDGNWFFYADRDRFEAWYARRARVLEAISQTDISVKTTQLVELTREFDARYLLVDYSLPPESAIDLESLGVELVYANTSYSLIHVK